MAEKFAEAMKSFPTAESLATSKYYRGGFDAKMTKREAALILGVSPTAPKNRVCISISSSEFKTRYCKVFMFNFALCR